MQWEFPLRASHPSLAFAECNFNWVQTLQTISDSLTLRRIGEVPPQRTAPYETISVVVPAFNEASTLELNMHTLLRYLELSLPGSHEVFIVDDGSADQTGAIARSIAARYPTVEVGHHVANRGLDAAVRTGVEMASGDYVVVWDGGSTYAPDTIGALISAAQERSCDIVLASAYMPGGHSTDVPMLRRWLNHGANGFLSLAVRGEFATLTCMVRVYRRAMLKDLLTMFPQAGTTFELLFAARAHGAIIHEIPVHLNWSKQVPSRQKHMSPGRMWKWAMQIVGCAVRYRPAIIFAVPGLFPGLLPLAVATALLLQQPLRTVWYIGIITVVVQSSSLLAFSGQLRAFFGKLFQKVASWPLARATALRARQ